MIRGLTIHGRTTGYRPARASQSLCAWELILKARLIIELADYYDLEPC